MKEEREGRADKNQFVHRMIFFSLINNSPVSVCVIKPFITCLQCCLYYDLLFSFSFCESKTHTASLKQVRWQKKYCRYASRVKVFIWEFWRVSLFCIFALLWPPYDSSLLNFLNQSEFSSLRLPGLRSPQCKFRKITAHCSYFVLHSSLQACLKGKKARRVFVLGDFFFKLFSGYIQLSVVCLYI